MNELFYRYGQWLVQHRVLAFIVIICISLLSAAGIVHRVQNEIPVDFTPQAIFMDKSPQMLRLREIEKTFGREDNDWVIILKGDLYHKNSQNYIEQLHTELESLPFVELVQSLYNSASVQNIDSQTEILSIWEGFFVRPDSFEQSVVVWGSEIKS